MNRFSPSQRGRCTNTSTHRSYKTPADEYFSMHGTIPPPKVMHAVLSRPPANLPSTSSFQSSTKSLRILVIGDLHGCLFETRRLVEKARKECNEGRDFYAVVFVGDLVNKGPKSISCLREVKNHPNYYAVRGNHDDGALKAALGDEARKKQEKYRWVLEGEVGDDVDGAKFTLSDEDVTFLSELPYTLSIPFVGVEEGWEEDFLVVHAGLIPGVSLSDQTIETMVTLRDIGREISTKTAMDEGNATSSMGLSECINGREVEDNGSGSVTQQSVPWATAWCGPELVLFGHDARRGLQRHAHAIGLDTGACYGKFLTGIVLPEMTFVSVQSLRAYSQTGDEKGGLI